MFPCLVEMRFKGVRVDENKSKALGDKLKRKQDIIVQGIKEEQVLIYRYGQTHQTAFRL